MANMPQTRLQLFKLDNCDSTYNYVTNFVGVTVDQYFDNYDSNRRYELNNLQYIRKNGIIDIPLIYDIAENFNYCRYDNGEGRGWEYSFITHKEFINFNMTRVSTQFDVWNNYIHIIKDSNSRNYVNRMHDNPTIISNIKPDIIPNTSTQIPYEQINEEMGVVHMLHIVLNRPAVNTLIPFYDPVQWFDVALDDISMSDLKTLLQSAWVNAIYYYNIPRLMLGKYTEGGYEVAEDVSIKVYRYDSTVLNESQSELEQKYGVLVYSELVDNIVGNTDDMKIWTYPYTSFKLKTSLDEVELNLGLYNIFNLRCNVHLSSNGVEITYATIDKYNTVAYLKDKGYSVPKVVSNYEIYYENNQSFMLGHITDIFSQLTSMGLRANPFTLTKTNKHGEMTGLVGGLTSLSDEAFSGVMSYVKTYGQINDMKVSPQNVTLTETIGDMFTVLHNNPLVAYIITSPTEINKLYIDNWNEYGYLTDEILPIKDVIRTRLFYNYLSLNDFYIADIYCEDDRKKLETILKNGVHIYHRSTNRDLNYGDLVSNEINYYVGG